MSKVLIATTDSYTLTWKTLNSKIKEIQTELNTAKNANFTVEVKGVYVKPDVANGRITHKWFNTFSYPLYRQGYDFVVLHMSDTQRKQWGIKPTLRGSSLHDTDFVGEMYVWANEYTTRKGFNQFVQTTLHELSHEIARGTGVKDTTHAYHDKHKDIKGLFKKYDLSTYLPIRQELLKEKTRLEKILASLTRMIDKPVPFLKGNYRVTQAFGTPNKIYTQTQHHIGTDFATPLGTLIYAPLAGKLTKTIGIETGIVATLETNQGTYQFLHLGHCAPDGTYTKGHVIGYTGNTGSKSTGPHVCVRKWKGKPNISILTAQNFKNYLESVI